MEYRSVYSMLHAPLLTCSRNTHVETFRTRSWKSLEREILDQSSRVEEMIAKACQALVERRPDLAPEVTASELEINVREVKIEEECLKILALHQPVAVDLRRTATVLKINTELERIADLAVNIAERTISLAEHPEFEMPAKLERMFVRASDMVHEALDAFVDWTSTRPARCAAATTKSTSTTGGSSTTCSRRCGRDPTGRGGAALLFRLPARGADRRLRDEHCRRRDLPGRRRNRAAPFR